MSSKKMGKYAKIVMTRYERDKLVEKLAVETTQKLYVLAAAYLMEEPEFNFSEDRIIAFRKDKHRVDLVNLEEAILDILVRSGVLADDCFSVVRSMDGSRVEVDKEYPRTEITITEVN